MKIRKSASDNLWYYLICILSFGIVFGIRVVITNAIKQALRED